jgi:hypothetical protein
LPVSGHRSDVPGHRRSARTLAAALGAGSVGPTGLEGHRAPRWPSRNAASTWATF